MSNMATIAVSIQEDNLLLQKTYRKLNYNSYKTIRVIISDVPDNNYRIINSSSVINAQSSNYQKTLQSLFEIDNTDCEEDEDEWGATRPTKYAWQLSLEILQQISEQIRFDFPLGFASLESDGGIEIIWKNYSTKNELRISIPSHEGSNLSLYIRNLGNGKSKLFANSSIKRIVRALQFLYQ